MATSMTTEDTLSERLDFIRAEQSQLHALIDKIQGARLTGIELPQIIVVGDQSAGKSSVLEALTGIPFPRKSGACTRFATEIRLRREAEVGLKIRIRPDTDRPENTQTRLHKFGGDLDPETAPENWFRTAEKEIVTETQFVTRDTLVVEKSGPKLPLLTLVDLPGLVHNENTDQSTKDLAAIEKLTDHYMGNSRTIILAVVGGNTDYAQAIVLKKARKFDSNGSRTIGVLTKPDCVAQIGLEQRFLDLVANKDHMNRMAQGWYVLLNPGHGDSWSATTRVDKEKAFFSTRPWSLLPREKCGAAALLNQLSTVQRNHVASLIPSLRSEVQQALDRCDTERRALGNGREKVEDMRQDIETWLSDSNSLAENAVSGDYNDKGRNFFPHQPDPRGTPRQNLRTRVVRENEAFAENLRLNGHSLGFTVDGHNDAKRNYAKTEVAQLIEQTMGPQFPGERHPRIPYWLFDQHSSKWSHLALDHLSKISRICNEFLTAVLEKVWPSHMQGPLRQHFLDDRTTKFHDTAKKELDALLKDLTHYVRPYDPDLTSRLDQWHAEAKTLGGELCSEAESVLQKSLILYDIVAKVFTRNVIVQVIERHFMVGVGEIFLPVAPKATEMSDETVKAITAENQEIVERRVELSAQGQALRDALVIIQNLPLQPGLVSSGSCEIPDDGRESSEDDSSNSVPSSGSE